jgi:hypothetical protein
MKKATCCEYSVADKQSLLVKIMVPFLWFMKGTGGGQLHAYTYTVRSSFSHQQINRLIKRG